MILGLILLENGGFMTIFGLFTNKLLNLFAHYRLYFLEALKSLIADGFGFYLVRKWWVYDNF